MEEPQKALSKQELARRFGVSKMTFYRWCARHNLADVLQIQSDELRSIRIFTPAQTVVILRLFEQPPQQ